MNLWRVRKWERIGEQSYKDESVLLNGSRCCIYIEKAMALKTDSRS